MTTMTLSIPVIIQRVISHRPEFNNAKNVGVSDPITKQENSTWRIIQNRQNYAARLAQIKTLPLAPPPFSQPH